jgi:putative transposase
LKQKVGNKYQVVVPRTAQETLRKWSFSCSRLWNWCLDMALLLYRENRNWDINYYSLKYKSPFTDKDGKPVKSEVVTTGDDGKEKRKSVTLYETVMDQKGAGFNGMLTVHRKHNPDFAETPNCCQQETLMSLDKAFKRFRFDSEVCKHRAMLRAKAETPKEKAKAERYAMPKFKSTRTDFSSLYFPRERFSVIRRGGKTYLHVSKLPQDIRILTDDREIPETLNGAVISFDPVKSMWFVSLKFDQVFDDTRARGLPEVAMDRGVRSTVMLSDGTEHNVPADDIMRLETRKERLQQVQARKIGSDKEERKSRNFLKVQHKIALIERKISDLRKNFAHQKSCVVAASHSVVYEENLKIAKMTKSKKGTQETPGHGVQAKADLNRKILRSGWGYFSQYLCYKLERRGGALIKVRPEYTSQTCSSCFSNPVDDPGSTTRDGKSFKCNRCGLQMDADLNASKVILARGQGNKDAFPKRKTPSTHLKETVQDSVCLHEDDLGDGCDARLF